MYRWPAISEREHKIKLQKMSLDKVVELYAILQGYKQRIPTQVASDRSQKFDSKNLLMNLKFILYRKSFFKINAIFQGNLPKAHAHEV